jgi:PilZ domain
MMRDHPSKKTAVGATPTAGKDLQPAKRRSVRRCPFVASAEVTELSSGTRLPARTSELGLGGCYIETLNPYPEGTLVELRILRDQGVFETKAKVVYSHSNFGMGLAFNEMMPNQRSRLEDWLAELVTQSRPAS